MEEEGGTCPICLQPFLQPVKLPCKHIFCYLCVKGSAFHRRRCPLCRGQIRMNFFDNPDVVTELAVSPMSTSDFVWYYSGNNGWWQYDERTAKEIELAYTRNLPKCEVFIAGHFYVIDFANMTQHRKDHSGRTRQIKRDSPSTSKKGVAGIRLSLLQGIDPSSSVGQEACSVSEGSPPPVMNPTTLDPP